jgi:hypothetical protein
MGGAGEQAEGQAQRKAEAHRILIVPDAGQGFQRHVFKASLRFALRNQFRMSKKG